MGGKVEDALQYTLIYMLPVLLQVWYLFLQQKSGHHELDTFKDQKDMFKNWQEKNKYKTS